MRYLKEGRFIYSEYYGSYLDNYCQNIEEENNLIRCDKRFNSDIDSIIFIDKCGNHQIKKVKIKIQSNFDMAYNRDLSVNFHGIYFLHSNENQKPFMFDIINGK